MTFYGKMIYSQDGDDLDLVDWIYIEKSHLLENKIS